jgi:cytochrome b561
MIAAGLSVLAFGAMAQPAPKTAAPAKAATPAKTAAKAAPAWRVDARNSAIEFSGQHAGAPFKGSFTQWSADIRFDPNNLSGSSARVTVQTGSARTSDATQTGTLKEPEWFNARQFPTAVFQTTAIKALGANRYEAAGMLTIKGKPVPVTLPFTLNIVGANAEMTGALTLDRRALGLGLSSDASGDWVSLQIPLSVRVKATRAP